MSHNLSTRSTVRQLTMTSTNHSVNRYCDWNSTQKFIYALGVNRIWKQCRVTGGVVHNVKHHSTIAIANVDAGIPPPRKITTDDNAAWLIPAQATVQ